MVLPRDQHGAARQPRTDRQLIEASLAGDERAFESIVRTHQASIYGALLSLTRDPESALDLTQEALLRAWRKLRTFDPSRSLRPWLLAIARNCWKDQRRLARSRYPHFSLDGADAIEPRCTREGPDGPVRREEQSSRLWQAMDALDPMDREALVFKDLLELSYQEVADFLDIPYGTAASRVFNARRHLRAIIRPDYTEAMAG